MTLTKARNRMIEGASINVLDFGAVGNGSTDDTIAVQEAINVSNGTPVVFNAGKTFLCGALTVPSNTHLIINGTIKASLTVTDMPLISGLNISNVIIEGTGNLDGGYNIAVAYQGRNDGEPTTRTDSSALQDGDTFYDTATGVKKFKLYDADNSVWNIITLYRGGIKLDKSVDCRIENITVENFFFTAQPGNWGAGVWFEGDPEGTSVVEGIRNQCVNVNASYNIGCGIVFGANLDSKTDRCYTVGNQWGSGIAHTRGQRATSTSDTLDGNELSNLTINCEESQIIAPNSRNSGYTGINIGHDREASNASRTLLIGGMSEHNDYEGLTVTGSSDVTIIGLFCNGNGENPLGTTFRYGISNLANCERLHLIGCKVTGSYGPGIYLKSGYGHRIESCKVYENLRSGVQINLPDVNISDCEIFNNNLLSDSVNRAGILFESGRSKITDTSIYDTRTTAVNDVTSTAGQTVFPYTFKVDEAVTSAGIPTGSPVPSQIRVERRGTPLTLNTDYRVSNIENNYTATNLQTVFAYTFDPTALTDLRVFKEGVRLTLTTDYTVSANAGVGGTVTLVSGATTGNAIRIATVGGAGGNVTIITGSQNSGDIIRISGEPDSLSDNYGATSGQTVFAYSFDPPALSDLRVVKEGVLLTLTTDYTVVANAGVGGVVTLVTGATTNDEVRITVVSQNYGVLATGGLHQLVGCSVVGNMQAPTKILSTGDIDITSTTIGNSPMGGVINLGVNVNTTVVANDNVTSASRIIIVPRFFESSPNERNTYVSSVKPGVSFTVSHSSGVTAPYNYIIM